MYSSPISPDFETAVICDGYGSGEWQELNLKTTISLKDSATVKLMSWFGQRYQSVAELISTSFAPVQR
ncbi:hypothetical protein TNCV_5091371 [Trichonephila clavipes]|nr:hypothetical protein TNCV_5091371 [Trichonephila clavipes]